MPTSGLAAWYDAGFGVTVTGSAVTAWADRTTQHDASTAVGTPSVGTGPNGQPVVQFRNSGGADYLSVDGGAFQARQVYTVFRSPIAAFNNFGNVFGSIPGQSRTFIFQAGQTYMHYNPYPEGVRKDGVSLAGPPPAGNFNMAPITNYMVLAVDTSSPTANRSYLIGRQDTYGCDLDIAEILVYSQALTLAQENQLGAYLAQKYGIATSYSHPIPNSIPDNSTVAIASGAVFDLNGVSETIGALADYPAPPSGGTVTNSASGAPAFLTLGAATDSNTFSGVIQDGASPISLVKDGGSTQVLAGANTYSGTTDVNGGTLLVNGTHTGGGTYTVDPGATLGGSGDITPAPVHLRGRMSPGSSIESFTTGQQTWYDGGSFLLEIDDADGDPGQSPGWDLLEVQGQLILTGIPTGGFTIELDALPSGSLPHFSADPYSDFAWDFVHTTGGIVDFDATMFDIDASAFTDTNPITNVFGSGQFGVLSLDDKLWLTFTAAVPEPSTFALASLGLLGLGLVGWRRRKRVT